MKKVLIFLMLCGPVWGGTIVSFGPNSPPIPAEFTGDDIVAIAAGDVHYLVLKSDGNIGCWQLDCFIYCHCEDIPNETFVAIASGLYGQVGIKSDGSLWGYGDIPEGNTFIKIAVNGIRSSHYIALDNNEEVFMWGHPSIYPLEDVNYRDITAGGNFNVGIKTDNTLVAWGRYNDYGECNAPAGNNYVAIGAGDYHGLAITEGGAVVGWGRNDYGQANTPDGNFIRVDGGSDYSLGIKEDGSLAIWGNTAGWALPEGNDFVDISTAPTYALALRSSITNTVTLTVLTEPNTVDSTLPVAGEYTYYRGNPVLVRTFRWRNCPEISELHHWSGDIPDPCAASQYIIMDANKAITAHYVLDEAECGDECHPISELYDVNRDCYVNMIDFATFAEEWGCTHPDCD